MTGYTLKEKRFISEVNADGYIYTHDKTGAKVIHLECDDPNKCFMISFPTMPEDSTGVAHINEHSVLAGSEKYPLKDPFYELVKGSLNTFLNAMTASDMTMYPFASTNEKDFMNILDIYMDAVLHPMMYTREDTFRQEGWHYEINENDELIINGIVYNEMRGAMSSPDRVLYQEMLSALFDNCYQYNSGGDPAVIPELTHEAFCAFHRKHYHPSNAIIYLYGNLNAEKVMTFIDEEYLSKFEYQEPVAPIVPTAAFSKPVELTRYYPVNTTEDEKGAVMLGEGVVLPGAGDVLTTTAMNILTAALFDTEASPVRRALLQSGLCSEVETEIAGDMCQGLLGIFVRGAEEENLAKIEELIDSTLANVYETGIDKDLLTGCLNTYEFRMREEHDGIPRGLLLGINIAVDTIYNTDYFASISYDKTLSYLREKIGSWYFEELIDKYIIGNTHKAIIHMLPKAGLAQERDRKLAEKLAAYKATLSESEIAKIKAEAEALKVRQMTPDAPETLELIPLLSLDDVRTAPEKAAAKETSFGDLPGLHIDVQSNGICYLRLVFDAGCLTDDDLHYAGLLKEIICKMDTAERDFASLSKAILLHTGGIELDVSAMEKHGAERTCIKVATLSAKVLTTELESAMKLIGEILNTTKFSDTAHLHELLGAIVAQQRAMLMYTGHAVAMSRVNASFSKTGWINEQLSGLEHVKWLETALARFDDISDKLTAGLDRVAKKLFCRANLTVAVTGGSDELARVGEYLPLLTHCMPVGEKAFADNSFVEREISEGIATASDSQYVAQGYDIRKLGYELNGRMLVLRTLLTTEYLTQRVRIVGGAYGCFAIIRSNGNCVFVSYRDPNLSATYDVYSAMSDYLADFNVSDRDILKFIIGTLSSLDAPEAPGAAGARCVTDYLCGITPADRSQWRNEVISTTAADIRGFADMIKGVTEKKHRCAFGGAEKVNSEKAVISEVITANADVEKYTF